MTAGSQAGRTAQFSAVIDSWRFRLVGEVSERQWRDVLSISRVQGSRIDHRQLLVDAGPLGLSTARTGRTNGLSRRTEPHVGALLLTARTSLMTSPR
jgi:hypothetical protein